PGARRTDSVGEALALLRAELAPGDVVLVKASRAAGLERVAAGLLDVRDDVRSAGAPRGAGAAGSVSR
ncbi:MAG: UDP-N-acetylmuramoyl-tripeptide--D-alanyl-D-alanine ligase, partial [Pseudonocardiales bacterium]|nr:UDP-N-acetylmuramoyl-tripeptide--D-alanyl-D-alanine ligase [Pseudonocardiales bacterium]